MLDKRLEQVFAQVKTGVVVPVILEVRGGGPALVRELSSLGLRNARMSPVSPLAYGQATETVARALSNNPAVVRVYYDEPVYTRESNPFEARFQQKEVIPLLEAVAATGAPHLWDAGLTGKGVKIAVIDTGVSQSHPMLRDAIRGTFSAVPEESVEDQQGHGSWCASAAAGRHLELEDGLELQGAAPEADLYCLKALAADGRGQMSWVIDCVEHAIVEMQADILSMSLGSLFDNAGADPISRLVNDAVLKYNVIPVIAAGNSFIPASIGSPGGAIQALTVGSVALKLPHKFAVSSFSSKGPTTGLLVKPDISACGGNIVTPGIGELILGAAAHEGYAYLAGTSMATPQVAGGIALLRQDQPNLSRAEIEQLLALAAFPRIKDTLTGYGMIDLGKMRQNLGKPHPQIAEMQNFIAQVQAIPFVPLSLLPHPEGSEVSEIRLPAFGG